MKNFKAVCFFSALFFVSSIFSQERIVSIGGTLTEIVFELGLGDKLVGIDATSVYPPDKVKEVVKLGYRQNISLEGIISLKPDLILASSKLAPKKLIGSLKKLKLNLVIVEESDSFESAKAKVFVVANSLGKTEKGKQLVSKLEGDLKKVEKQVTSKKRSKKKLVFIYARGGNRIFLSGADTAAHEMITLAGAQNAFSAIKGFKPITTESLIKSNPDAIVMLRSGMESLKNPWTAIKGIEHTAAGKNKKMIVVDDSSFLGFGPRSGKELLELSKRVQKL